jgi:division protein CdvB (Snf7/Vps24/ESCRT-III family)
MHSDRVTYLATAEQRAALDAFAKEREESVGSVLRDAAAQYMGQPTAEEEAELKALVEEVNKVIPQMAARLDSISRTLREAHEEVDRTLRAAGVRK